MKTYNHLLEKICDKENVRKALHRAAKGKKQKRSVKYALENEEEVIEKISQELKTLSWMPPKIHTARSRNDGLQLKKRMVVCPEFIREQIVHHAILAVLYPLFIKKFYRHSCGSVKGRGVTCAVLHIAKQLKGKPKKTKYVCKMDIRKFFASVRPSFVFKELRKTIRDKRVLILLSRILRYNTLIFNGERIKNGLPIGFYTSPFFANVVLNSLDHEIKEKCGVFLFVRYMDDILLSDSNKRRIKRTCKYIMQKLGKIKLVLKAIPQCHILKTITFLGHKFYRDKVILGRKLFLKSKRQFCRASKRKMTVYLARKLLSYSGYFKNIDMGLAFKKYVSNYVCLRYARFLISFYERKNNEICKIRIRQTS